MTTITCKNCGEHLKGKFCHNCGEKIVEISDFSIKTMLGQILDGIFNIDSKVFKTFKYLLFKPGCLTKKYVEGIRQPLMRPIQLFLIINVLFFLFLTDADILRIPAQYFFNNNNEIELTEMSRQTGISEVDLKHQFDSNSTNYSKALVIVLIPFFAFILMFVNFKKRFFFGQHIIFSIHYFSFFLIFCVLLIGIQKFGNRIIQLVIVIFNFIYLYFAIKTFYRDKIWTALIKALITLVFFLSLILIYREFISNLTFKLLP